MKDILITSSVLIAAIMLLRFLFHSTISRRAQYALWLLVALRLLVPFNLPAMEHNVLSVAEQTETVQNLEALRGVDSIEHTASGTVEGYERYKLMPDTPVTVAENVAPERFERMQTTLKVRDVIEPLWYGGMAAMALWFLTANLRFARMLRRTRVSLDGAESKYPVYLCDDIPSPCLLGLFRPAIYVTSEAAKDENRLRYVIAHEETHARHLDPLWSLVRSVCLVIWWFDPLVWLAAYCSKTDCELACDEGTLARLGEAARMPYGETLLALIPVRRAQNPMLTATTMTAGKRQMKDRITRIAQHKRPVAIALVLALALSGVVCAATFTGAEQRHAAMTEEEALDALEESVEWWTDERGVPCVAFTIPEAYEHAENWGLHIAGRAVYEDGMSMSRHYFEGETWTPGGRYVIEINNHTNLIMQAALVGQKGGLYEREINLLPTEEKGGGAVDNVARWEVDLDGDGTAERIAMDVSALVPGSAAGIWLEDFNGNKLYDLGEIGLPHVGWRTLALTEQNGRTYLLDYSPTMFQGEAEYTYALMELRGGTLDTVELQRVAFSVNAGKSADNNADAMRRFQEKANEVWAHSRLLFTTDQEVLVRLYDTEGKPATSNGSYYIAGEGETVRYYETMYGLLDDTADTLFAPNAPSEEGVIFMRERVERGMTEEDIKYLTEMVMVEHYWWEYQYLYLKTFDQMRNPDSLLWNYIDHPGEIQIGWVYDGNINKDAVCAQEGLTEDEFYTRYAQKAIEPNNTHDADSFRQRMTALKASVKSGLLDEDFDRMIALCEQARETHDVGCVIELYHMLHDMDYYLLRYGPSDVGRFTVGPSIASEYYGCLSIWHMTGR